MTISIWRYSHLALAISSFIFVLLASITGIILAFQPISEKLEPYAVTDLDTITLEETIAAFKTEYPEVLSIKIDENNFVSAYVFTEDGESLEGYFNPKTALYIGEKQKPSSFFQWVTNFHRSLFLKGIGRFFVGLSALLLFLIAVTGTLLIIKKLGSVKQFFSKLINDNSFAYWHTALGRFTLIPILIITLTGVYLSLEQFNLLPNTAQKSKSPKNTDELNVFKSISLDAVTALEFPFSNDADDPFILKTKTGTLKINQLTGQITEQQNKSNYDVLSSLSTSLHTGRGSVIWSLVLLIATINILFFMYSGFAITLKRTTQKVRNTIKAKDAEYNILFGSENGNTVRFANTFYKQLKARNQKVFIAEMNKFKVYPNLKHLIVFTATYGEGEAPTNAVNFIEGVKRTSKVNSIQFSVVGFGSLAYPNFCKFAKDSHQALSEVYKPMLPVFTINDNSVDEFLKWSDSWSEKIGLDLKIDAKKLVTKPKRLKKFKVVSKTDYASNPDQTFLMQLDRKWNAKIRSGDLLAIYPNNDYRERLYSIGKNKTKIHLSVKLHENGLGSGYLSQLQAGDLLKARVVKNTKFYVPKRSQPLIFIANGTGIAPFLGMMGETNSKAITLYFGLRTPNSFEIYKSQLDQLRNERNYVNVQLAYSKGFKKQYVQDLVWQDSDYVSEVLNTGGTILICGSIAMCNGVTEVLTKIAESKLNNPLSYYLEKGQIKTDCY